MAGQAPIIVTSAHTRVGFNVARSLSRAGRAVVAIGRYRPTMCHGLAGLVAQYACCDPYRDTSAFLELVLNTARRHGAEIVLPTHEEIYVIALHRERLRAAGLRVCAPQLADLLRLHDKGQVSLFATIAGVPAPKTVVAQTSASLEQVLTDIGPSFIVKPRWGSGSMGIRRVRDRKSLEELTQAWSQDDPAGRYVVQEIVPGRGAGVGVLVGDGRTLACAGHIRIREVPISGGTSTARRTLQHAEILDAAEALVAASGFDSGVCMVEFRYDASTDRFWVLEFNPRYWGGLSTAVESGVDFPRLHLASFEGVPLGGSVVKATRLSETRWALGEVRAAWELACAREWTAAAGLFVKTPGHKLYVEDFGIGRFAAFGSELLGYLRTLWTYGNFGQQSRERDVFFDQLMEQEKVNHAAAIEKPGMFVG